MLTYFLSTDADAAQEPRPGGRDRAGAAGWGSGCSDQLHRPSHHEHREAHLPDEEAAVAPAEWQIHRKQLVLAGKRTVGSLIKLMGIMLCKRLKCHSMTCIGYSLDIFLAFLGNVMAGVPDFRDKQCSRCLVCFRTFNLKWHDYFKGNCSPNYKIAYCSRQDKIPLYFHLVRNKYLWCLLSSGQYPCKILLTCLACCCSILKIPYQQESHALNWPGSVFH